MMQWPDIIVLNGSSSAGKTSLAYALQDNLSIPYLYFSFDTLIMSAPKRYWQDSAGPQQNADNPYLEEGVKMVEVQEKGQPKKIKAVFGPFFQSIIHTMPSVVVELVKQGNKVIFDHVYHDQKMFDDCKQAFAPYNVLTIGVHCPLEILEQRERERGDRVIGRARGLFDVVHQFGSYDINVDTSELTTEQALEQIRQSLP